MGSPRVKGTALGFTVDGYDWWADCTSTVLDGEDVEVERNADGVPRVVRAVSWIDVEAVQSTDRDSLWTFLWEHAGEVVPFAFAVHGNEEPTLDEPHFVGTLRIPGDGACSPAPLPLGGGAGVHVEQTFATRLYITTGPQRVTE